MQGVRSSRTRCLSQWYQPACKSNGRREVIQGFGRSLPRCNPDPSAPLRILGLESSADDTCAAIVDSGKRILANIVLKQQDLLGGYGRMNPEGPRAFNRRLTDQPALGLAQSNGAVSRIAGSRTVRRLTAFYPATGIHPYHATSRHQKNMVGISENPSPPKTGDRRLIPRSETGESNPAMSG